MVMVLLPNTPHTRNFIGQREFEAMRKGVLFFNTGRGQKCKILTYFNHFQVLSSIFIDLSAFFINSKATFASSRLNR